MELNNIDLYALLGIHKHSHPKTIKDAYRRKARQLHSDKAKPGLSAEQLQDNQIKLSLINQAYAILSDQHKRRLYDMEYAADLGELKSDFQFSLSGQYSQAKELRDQRPLSHEELLRQREEDTRQLFGQTGTGYAFAPRKISMDEFNKQFEETRPIDPNDFGYSEELGMSGRTTSTSYNPDDFSDYMQKQPKMFQRRRDFNIDKFNTMFDRYTEPDPNTEIEEIHNNDDYEPDGFSNFNDQQVSTVNSFNGLMITGETSGGFSSNNFTDYKQAFQNNIITNNMKKSARQLETDPLGTNDFNKRLNALKANRSVDIDPLEKNRNKAQTELLERKRREIDNFENKNKHVVEKYSSQFSPDLIDQAFNQGRICDIYSNENQKIKNMFDKTGRKKKSK